MKAHSFALALVAAAGLLTQRTHAQTGSAAALDLRPRPQVVSRQGAGLPVTGQTRIVLPAGWPPYVKVAAVELARTLKASFGVEPAVVVQERLAPQRGDIVIGPYWAVQPQWIEPIPAGLLRPSPPEGHNIHITERNAAVLGNTPRACFLGLQTLIQIARQGPQAGAAAGLPGLLIADWPAHGWRTLQLHLAHTGSPYDRGEHVYRVVTKADILVRAVRLAAYHKMTGLVVDVESGMRYDRHPENFTTGISRNEKAQIRAAVDLAKSLGIQLVPKSNSSSGHDGWVIPYAFAAPNTDIYLEELHDLYDELIETFRPAHFHVGLDEDVFPDMDGRPLRDVAMHKRLLLADYEFLLRRGVTMLVWNDGVTQLGADIADVPRDILVLPWMYGGWDFTPAQRHIDQGFRILCSPWSCWHVENDQFFSLFATTLHSDRVLGMAGTFWYTVAPDGESDYRRCLVKAADAFWNPLQAGDYPNEAAYYAPNYDGLPGDAPAATAPTAIPPAEIAGVVALVTDVGGDGLAREAARERLVAAGTAVMPPLLEVLCKHPDDVSPWAEGTLRRIVREPLGDKAALTGALRSAVAAGGALRPLALELLGLAGDSAFLETQSATDPAVALALGISGDRRFLPALREAAAGDGPAQAPALLALGRLKGLDELLSLKDSWSKLDEAGREAYARALAMQGADSALDVLAALSRDESWRVRFRAAVGLGATQSVRAGPHILKLLADKHPAVFRTALYWCTDTLILKPDEYFPALTGRLTADEDPEIARAILHTLELMWDPRCGQWLARNEDPAQRVDYPSLSVWKDPALRAALHRVMGHRDARLAAHAMIVLLRMGAKPETDTVVAAVRQFSLEDQRWFCERMRDERRPELAPVFARLWELNDRLIRNFILQYCGLVVTPETFEIACWGPRDIPDSDPVLRGLAIGSMAAHVQRLDDTARRAIPFILDLYGKADAEGRRGLDAALSRAAGQKPAEQLDNEPAAVSRRMAEWQTWWEQHK
jgi:HEAT repeat protein